MNLNNNQFRLSTGSAEFFSTLGDILGDQYKHWTLESQGIDREAYLGIVPRTRVIAGDLSGTLLALAQYEWAVVEHRVRVQVEMGDSVGDARAQEAATHQLALLDLERSILQHLAITVARLKFPSMMYPFQSCAPMVYRCFLTRRRKVDFVSETRKGIGKAREFLEQFLKNLVWALGSKPTLADQFLDRDDLPSVPVCTCGEKGCAKHDLLDVRDDKNLSAILSIVFAQSDALQRLVEADKQDTSMYAHYYCAYRCATMLLRYRALVLKPAWHSGSDCAIVQGPKLMNVPTMKVFLSFGPTGDTDQEPPGEG